MKNLNKENENLLLELEKLVEEKNKKLIFATWTILVTNAIFYSIIIFLSTYILKEDSMIIVLISTLIFVIVAFVALKFEVDAGFYNCKNCNHKFAIKYKEALISMHIGTTRYLKCPNCKKKTWSKKIYK